MIRVMVFSYIRLFSETLESSIKVHSNDIVVMSSYKPNQLAEDIKHFQPDIVLVDITSEQSLKKAKAMCIAYKDTAFVALAVPEIPQEVIACADAGFIAYVPRTSSLVELIDILQRALNGECVCAPKIAGSLLQEVRRRGYIEESPENKLTKALTRRECEILELLGEGLSNKLIANRLNLSLSTVKNHLHNVFSKLQVTCRTEAVSRINNEMPIYRAYQ